MRDEIIIRNSIRCLKCGDEIESKHRHDLGLRLAARSRMCAR